MSRAGAGQEQGRSRAEQSKAEQGRKRAGAGQELGSRSCSYSTEILPNIKELCTDSFYYFSV